MEERHLDDGELFLVIEDIKYSLIRKVCLHECGLFFQLKSDALYCSHPNSTSKLVILLYTLILP